MKRLVLATFFVFILFSSCVNYFAAREIKHKYPKHYNGIDTLIKIGGYYFNKCENSKCGPLILNANGAAFYVNGKFDSDAKIAEHLNSYFPNVRGVGNYNLQNDTLFIRWADRFDLMSYVIFEAKFIIHNDSTLIRVYRQSRIHDEKVVNSDTLIYCFKPFLFHSN